MNADTDRAPSGSPRTADHAARPAGPLAGIGVLVTRPEEQSGALVQGLLGLGARVLSFPAMIIEGLPEATAVAAAAATMGDFHLAFYASANAVRFGLEGFDLRGADARHLPSYAVGPATAAALRRAGVARVAQPEAGADSEALLALPELQDLRGRRALLVSGEGGRTLMRDVLTERGAEVTVVPCYRRLPPGRLPRDVAEGLTGGHLHTVLLTSSEGLRNLHAAAGGLRPALRTLCHVTAHPRIAEAAAQAGAAEVVLATGGDEALMAAVVERFGRHPDAGERATAP